ncbi:MAG: hypothetical protein PHI15_05760 [Methanomicrobium sp.]|nr:hypothetical protein [Methanomicrobium sp.]
MSKGEDFLVIPNHNTVAKGTQRELIKDAGLNRLKNLILF